MAELLVHLDLALGTRVFHVELGSSSPAIALVGPSGAGKSTLLRVLAGVEGRARGTVRFGGDLWQDEVGTFVPAWQRRAGWVPQDGVLFPHLSVAENLGYAARLDVAPLAALLGIDHLLARRPRHLSGGERQGVARGRAMASDPALLLLDEPFSALDRPLRAQLGAAVRQWAQARGTPLVAVSHDAGDVEALADEVWEISAGRVQRVTG